MSDQEEDVFDELIRKNGRLAKYKLSRRAHPSSDEPVGAEGPVEAVAPESNGGAATEAAIRSAIRNYWGLDEDEEEKLRRRK